MEAIHGYSTSYGMLWLWRGWLMLWVSTNRFNGQYTIFIYLLYFIVHISSMMDWSMDLAKHRGVTACSQNWDSIFKQWGLNQCDLTATVYGFPPVSILGSLRLNDMNLLLAFSSFKVPTIWWVGFPTPQIVGVGVASLDLSAWLFDRKSWPPCRRNIRSWQMRAVMSLLLWKRLVTGITYNPWKTKNLN